MVYHCAIECKLKDESSNNVDFLYRKISTLQRHSYRSVWTEKNNTKVGATTKFLALYQKSKNILVPSAPLIHDRNTLHESVHSLLKVTHSSIEVVFDKT